MTIINILIVSLRYGNRDRLSGHTGGEICHFAVKLPIGQYLTIMWWERTQFFNSTFWRLVFSHSWFRIHLQLDFVSLEMNSEPLVWEHQSPKCFGGEPTSLSPKCLWQVKLHSSCSPVSGCCCLDGGLCIFAWPFSQEVKVCLDLMVVVLREHSVEDLGVVSKYLHCASDHFSHSDEKSPLWDQIPSGTQNWLSF